MSQINLHVTPAFERALARLMRLRQFATKSEAIRVAVEEAAGRAARPRATDFAAWRGLGKRAAVNPKPRFRSDDDLWR